jgi:sugar/nucleoside kinase (ribokinase family)
MSLLVTGSLGIDTVITPHAQADEVLGGSAVYFAFAARHFTDVRLVGVVGEDFPPAFRDLLASADIDLAGLETRKGSKTFRWTGKYSDDMNQRDTLSVELNVLAEEGAKVPPAYADSDVVFLANTHPALQRQMRAAIKAPRLTVLDTMDLWIETERDALYETFKVVDGVVINDGEAKQLTGKSNVIDAGQTLLEAGPTFAVVKKGEHGAMLITKGSVTTVPAYPTKAVKDPTGAGDSFAGGMLGYLATQKTIDDDALRRSLVRGTITASFAIEDFSLGRVKDLDSKEIDQRVAEFVKMLRIE